MILVQQTYYKKNIKQHLDSSWSNKTSVPDLSHHTAKRCLFQLNQQNLLKRRRHHRLPTKLQQLWRNSFPRMLHLCLHQQTHPMRNLVSQLRSLAISRNAAVFVNTIGSLHCLEIIVLTWGTATFLRIQISWSSSSLVMSTLLYLPIPLLVIVPLWFVETESWTRPNRLEPIVVRSASSCLHLCVEVSELQMSDFGTVASGISWL